MTYVFRRWAASGLVLLASSLIAVHVRAAEGSFERTLKVTGPVELEVATGSGHINVTTGDSSTVHIHATIRSNGGRWFSADDAERKVRTLESNPPIEQSNNFI